MRSFRDLLARYFVEILITGGIVWCFQSAVALYLGNRPLLWVLTGVVGLIFLLVYCSLKEWRDRRPPRVGLDEGWDTPRKAVVFTLSLRSAAPDSVARLVIHRLKPEWVGFLGTPATEQAGVAAELCSSLGLNPDRVKVENWDPTRVKEGVAKTGIVLDWLADQGVPARDVVLDVTGGTATMSIAAFMAAQDRRIDTQYVLSDYDSSKNTVIPGKQRPVLLTRYE